MKNDFDHLCGRCLHPFGLVAFIGLSGRNKNEEQQYRFYYINSDETRLKEEKYTPEKETTEVMLRNFSESLNNRETREDGISLFPDGVKISSYSIQDGVLNVEFNEAYDKMSRTRELLVRAGIVKIFYRFQEWILWRSMWVKSR